MADTETKLRFQQLNENNYPIWSKRMRGHLVLKGWAANIDGAAATRASAAAQENDDAKVLAEIQAYVDDAHLRLIFKCKRAYDAWETLCHAYEEKSKAHKLQLRRALYGISMRHDETVAAYVGRGKTIMDDLQAADVGITEDEVCMALLSGLPDRGEYQIIKTVLRTTGGDLSLESLKVKLQQGEADQQEADKMQGPARALMAGRFKWRNGPRGAHAASDARMGGTGDADKRRCWTCGARDHIKRNCPKSDGGQRGDTYALFAA